LKETIIWQKRCIHFSGQFMDGLTQIYTTYTWINWRKSNANKCYFVAEF